MSTQDSPARPDESQGLRVPRPRRVVNPDARMPLMEHIRELRNRVLKALLAGLIGAIIGWFLFPHIWTFIESPFCKLPAHVIRNPYTGKAGNGCGNTLVVNGLFDGLFVHLKVAIVAGLIFSSPIWMYQLWAFLAPGLYARERRWTYFFAGTAIPLFLFGGTCAYFAMTKGLRFLLYLVPHGVFPLITIDAYLGYAIAMLLVFGLAFELPLVVILLNLAGILTHQRFRKSRRLIIFAVFAFAAIATPSPDPISMLLLAVPCVLLVEAAEIFVWAHDKRKARREALEYAALGIEPPLEYDPDAAAQEIDTGPSGGV
ncbi:MAG: twin-arginine translocase subunit TatC [Streptosporangiaceae bacterium]|jgi:sec-independent protein translocase protein TatC